MVKILTIPYQLSILSSLAMIRYQFLKIKELSADYKKKWVYNENHGLCFLILLTIALLVSLFRQIDYFLLKGTNQSKKLLLPNKCACEAVEVRHRDADVPILPILF